MTKRTVSLTTNFRWVIIMLAVILYIVGFFIDLTSGKIMLVKIMCFAASAVCYAYYVITEKSESEKEQFVLLNIFILLFHGLVALTSLRTLILIRYYSALFQVIVWTGVPLAIWVYGLFRDRDPYDRIVKLIKDNRVFLIGTTAIAIVVIVCSYDTDGPHFVWNSNLAYNFVQRDTGLLSLFQPRELLFCAHVAFSYFYPVVLFTNLLGSVEMGFFVCNACYIVAATFGFALMLRRVFKHEKTYIILLGTTACMLSPFIFGLATYYLYDYVAICITSLLLYTAYDKKWVLFIVCGMITSFVKEPALIFFAAVCAGILIWEIAIEKKSVRSIIRDTKYRFMLLAGIVFAVLYTTIGNYMSSSPEETYGLNISHALRVTKQFFVLNYTWILTILAFVLIAYVIMGKAGLETKRAVVICSVPAIAFLLFNWIVQSRMSPRYVNCFYSCILFMAVVCIITMAKKPVVRCVELVSLCVLFIIADYTSTDPISKLLFERVDIGETKLFSSSTSDKLADNLVYNRQYYGFDIVMSMIYAKAAYTGDEILAVSTGSSEGLWEISGKWDRDFENGEYAFTEYYDTKKSVRAPFYLVPSDAERDRFKEINVEYIFPKQDPDTRLMDKDSFMYVYIPSQNGGRENHIRDSFDIVEEGSFEYRGWTVSYMRGIGKSSF